MKRAPRIAELLQAKACAPARCTVRHKKGKMKRAMVELVYLGCCFSLCAGEPAPLELKGIVQFPSSEEPAQAAGTQTSAGNLLALIEFQSHPQRAWEEFALLGEGQRQGGVEVIKIDSEAGTVQAKVNGESRELSLALPKIPKRAVR